MASKTEGEKLQGFICPLCLDVFKNATLLNCGHTFCRGCLEAYDEQHHDLDHITCPVCRQKTDLGQKRVAGLTPNFSLKCLEDSLNVDDRSSSREQEDSTSEFCSLHKKEPRTIFCEACEEFICLSCYIEHHQGHRIKKKEELERDIKKRTAVLLPKCKERQIQISKSVEIGDYHKRTINLHFDNMDREVRGAFAKKFMILQENEENLLGKVDELRRKSVEQMDKWISEHTRLISTMNSLVSVLTDDASKQCTVDTLKSHHLTCSELAEVLKEAIDEDSAGHIKDSVASAHFRIADDKLLDLGYIDVGVKEERRSTPSVSTQDCMERESRRKPDSSRKLVDIAPVFTKGFVYVVKRVKLRHNICGMAALSEEAVVVGYGGSRKGSDCISISGDRKTHLNNTVGHVNGITFLTDGRPVVGHSKNAFSVYNQQGTHCESKYRCQHGDSYIMVCHDQDDNIYAVNGSEEIFIFKDGKFKRAVYVDDMNPEQICVTKTGDVMIVSNYDQLTVIDREGNKGTTMGDDWTSDDSVHVAVDSQDRVWVAKVMDWDTMELRLTRYALQGTRLIKETTFRQISLAARNAFLGCHMVSLTPSRLVFADGDLLYFMELPEPI